MKISIYELLGMIKNNNAPKQIEFSGMKWDLKEDDYYWSDGIYLDEYCDLTKSLNDEVKILDIEYLNNDLGKKLLEPFYKIEKLNKNRYIGTDISIIDDMFDKINEIIDKLNGDKENE